MGSEAFFGTPRPFGIEGIAIDRGLENNIIATAFPRPRLQVYTSVE